MDEYRGDDGAAGAVVSCDEARVGLSAMLDGEDPGVAAAALRGHVAGCGACRGWQEQAARVSRLVRVRGAEQVPDLTVRVLAAVHADETLARRAAREPAARRRILRVALGVAAVVQGLLALPAIGEAFAGGGAGGLHVSREMASFDLAVAVGFLLVAVRPERARAFLPVAVVLAACLMVTTMVDVANASTEPVHEVGHLIVVVQAVLLWTLAHLTPRPVGSARSAHP